MRYAPPVCERITLDTPRKETNLHAQITEVLPADHCDCDFACRLGERGLGATARRVCATAQRSKLPGETDDRREHWACKRGQTRRGEPIRTQRAGTLPARAPRAARAAAR